MVVQRPWKDEKPQEQIGALGNYSESPRFLINHLVKIKHQWVDTNCSGHVRTHGRRSRVSTNPERVCSDKRKIRNSDRP